jgi:hypothetical protein
MVYLKGNKAHQNCLQTGTAILELANSLRAIKLLQIILLEPNAKLEHVLQMPGKKESTSELI